jgi:hypothetical protein
MHIMKKTLLLIGAASFLFASCSKEVKTEEAVVSAGDKAKIAALGFNASSAQVTDGGFLVEGDIFLSPANLNEVPSSPLLRIAEVEQYNTFNLVTGLPRTISVSASGDILPSISTAINDAIARYNAQNLQLTFVRVASGGQINIRIVNGGNYIASAGFPSGGNPYYEVKFNKQYQGYSRGFLATVLAHEMGHCIGFRHTDYMNRAFSCGSGGNEGQSTTGVGAVHIPGTPTGPDAASWMLACLSSTTDRPFNSNDRTALNYLY